MLDFSNYQQEQFSGYYWIYSHNRIPMFGKIQGIYEDDILVLMDYRYGDLVYKLRDIYDIIPDIYNLGPNPHTP